LEVDPSTWERHGRDPAFLNHRQKRFVEAKALVGAESYRKPLGKAELDYLAACQAAEQMVHKRARRVRALVGALATVIVWDSLGMTKP
jgi:hypothetical protein